jgi:tetratricopeptide (TPR) repeat protein
MITSLIRTSVLLCAVAVVRDAASAEEYADADAAYKAGAAHLRQMQYDEARAPLEAALKLAPDDAFRIKTYQALTPVYRRLPEAEPMITAQEFLIEHAERRTERSLAARGLVSFLFQRGLLDKNVERWEERLKKDADDVVGLSTLTAAYGTVKRQEKDRLDELAPRLAEVEKKRSAAEAERLEKEAAAKPAQAALLWKDAAVAWRDAGNKEKALAAAAEATRALPPDGILLHFFHRGLGEVYADCGKHADAVAHLEKAIAATAIQGYKDECQARIDKLRTLQVP